MSWDDTAEVSVDPMSDENDFVGYKLYRSTNQGRTWGEEDRRNKNTCLSFEYERIAQYSILYLLNFVKNEEYEKKKDISEPIGPMIARELPDDLKA